MNVVPLAFVQLLAGLVSQRLRCAGRRGAASRACSIGGAGGLGDTNDFQCTTSKRELDNTHLTVHQPTNTIHTVIEKAC
jgi:hypothetical protein